MKGSGKNGTDAKSILPISCKLWRQTRLVWMNLGLRPRLFSAFLLVALVPTIVLFFAQYQHSRRNTLAVVQATLVRMTAVQQHRLNLELRRLSVYQNQIAGQPQLRSSLGRYLQNGDSGHKESLLRVLGEALGTLDRFEGIWVRDAENQLVAGFVKDERPDAAVASPPLFVAAGEPLEIEWFESDTPHLWLNGPMTLEGERIGSLHILTSIDDFLAVLEGFPCKDTGGETVLLFRDHRHGVRAHGGLCEERSAAGKSLLAALKSGQLTIDTAELYDSTVPVRVGNQILLARPLDYSLGDVLVHVSLSAVNAILWGQAQFLLILVFFSLFLCLLMALLLTRMIARPVRSLIGATRALRQGDATVRITERSWGEFTELSRSFNRAMRMLARRTEDLNTEIEARRLSQQQLVDLANTDTLTGLINRRHFMDVLKRFLSETGNKGGCAGALLYLDLDDFKPINDHLGHEAGDHVLQVIAGRLRHLLRDGDFAARLGGDEFALLLMENGGPAFDPEKVARRVEEQIALPMKVKDQIVHVGCSLGVVRMAPGDDPHEVLNRADKAMYRVKFARRNRTA